MLQQIVSHSQGWLHTHLTAEIWNLSVLSEDWAIRFSRSLYVVLHKKGWNVVKIVLEATASGQEDNIWGQTAQGCALLAVWFV